VAADLKDQIQDFMERGVHRLSARDAVGRPRGGESPFPHGGSRSKARLGTIAAGVAVLACAAVLTATQLSGSPGTPRHVFGHSGRVVLTAATLRHLASASRLALARSGRVVVHSREISNGVLQNTGTDVITFSGKDWNDSFSEVIPGLDGSPASTQSAINRVVNGQAYDYFVAIDGKRWYHVTGPDAIASMNIPDPRGLLAELAPAARFAVAGHAVLDGVAVTKLVATDPAALPALNNVQIWPGGTISMAAVWVDASGVVRQLSVSSTRTVHGVIGPRFSKQRKLLREMIAVIQRLRSRHLSTAAARKIVSGSRLGRELRKDRIFAPQLIRVATAVTVSFTDIGQPQVISVPAGAVRISSVG
jgi:hypothetical protein